MYCIQSIRESNACIDNYLYKPYFFNSLFSRLVLPIMSLTRLGALPMDRPRSRLSLLFVLLFLLISVSSSHSAANILEGIVVKVAEGDTITVLDSDRVQHRVRIAGIDAPEKNQPFGNASGKRLGELVARKKVRVEFDKHDHYGRIVGKVLVTPPDCPTCGKTLDVGLAQITTGMAWGYRKYANEQSPEDQAVCPSFARALAGCGRRDRRGDGFTPAANFTIHFTVGLFTPPGSRGYLSKYLM